MNTGFITGKHLLKTFKEIFPGLLTALLLMP